MRPTTEEMFFLPQRPYCTLGPLRDQITYPLSQGRVAGGGNEGEGEVQGKTATTPSGGDSVVAADDDELLALLKKVSSRCRGRSMYSLPRHRTQFGQTTLSSRGVSGVE